MDGCLRMQGRGRNGEGLSESPPGPEASPNLHKKRKMLVSHDEFVAETRYHVSMISALIRLTPFVDSSRGLPKKRWM